MIYSHFLKDKLFSLIEEMECEKKKFVKRPDKDFTRNRKITFKKILEFFLLIEGKSIGTELLESFQYSNDFPTVSAFIQQRDKLKKNTFEFLFREFNQVITADKKYKNYRLLAVDGSKLIIPHNPQEKSTYLKPYSDKKGYNALHLNLLYDLLNKIYLDVRVQSAKEQHETKAIKEIVLNSNFKDNILLIADRGYENYNTFANILEKGWKFLIRVKDIGSSGMLRSFDLPKEGEFDINIHRTLTWKRSKEIKSKPHIYRILSNTSSFDFLDEENKFYEISFRVVRIRLENGTYQCFITNLEKEEFSLNDIHDLYHLRWGIETSFRDLKHQLGLTYLHSKKAECIFHEIFSKLVIFNFCSTVSQNSVVQKKKRKYIYQVNFSKVISICKYLLKLRKNATLPDIEALIQKFIVPIRPGRTNPRKTRSKPFISFQYRLS